MVAAFSLRYTSAATPDSPDQQSPWLRQMVEPFGTRRDGQTRPLPAMWLPAAPTRSTKATGADTADADAERADTDPGTPDVHTGQWTADRGHHMRGHWTFTPDTGHRTRGRDRVLGQGDSTRQAPDRHPGPLNHPTARWDAESWTCGQRLLRSRTTTARRDEVPASARLPTALPGACSVALSAKPRPGALLSSDDYGSSVKRTATLHPL